MNAGKVMYDNIPIPERLEEVINNGIRRASRQKILHRARNTMAGAAAAVCILFAGANIMPIYSYAADIPILGSIVRVFHIGSGGEVTDGAHMGADSRGESVELTFGDMSSAPYYTVKHMSAPNRIVLTLNGVRGADFESIREALMGAEAVQDVYRNMVLDDSRIEMTIVLNSGWGFAVSEYENPGTIMLDFQPDVESAEGTVYYLRTEAMGYTDRLGNLCEEYYSEGASQLKTLNGNYIVTIGQYATQDEAEEALKQLNEEHGGGVFYVASGAVDEIPKD